MGGALVMALSQLGSIHALEQTRGVSFWRRWLGREPGSEDTVGRVAAQLEVETLRKLLRNLYSRLKRNKALQARKGGLLAVIVDGHEVSASYKRCCAHCLSREIRTGERVRRQYYHRLVMAMLSGGDFPLLLDVELQRPGEDEGTCALRLLERIQEQYPRAFDLIMGDALYAQARVFQFALRHGKHALCVLKDERRDLMADAKALMQLEQPALFQSGRISRQCWDIEHLRTWSSLGSPVRVVRSLETTTPAGDAAPATSEWFWVSTIPAKLLPLDRFPGMAHDRWDIENQGFNELATYWHADHVYKHDANAIIVFWLVTMLAYNLFHAFRSRNLKPPLRFRFTKLRLAEFMKAELLLGKPRAPS